MDFSFYPFINIYDLEISYLQYYKNIESIIDGLNKVLVM